MTPRFANATIVATSGCFDILHAGHVDLLRRAKDLGDILVVLLNSDRSVASLKAGKGRPVNTYAHRHMILSELKCVDEIVAVDDLTPCSVLELLRPNVYVKGDEYKNREIPEELLVRSYGGLIVYLPREIQISTTQLLARGDGRLEKAKTLT